MLIVKDKWITSYREQIHCAFMDPEHQKFFCSKFQLEDNIYDTIAWRYIGCAWRNLHRELNARIAKNLYNWLNSGRQKGLMEHDPTCPMTRGCFLANGWMDVIRHYTHDKTEQKMKAILLGLWHNILEPIWEVRNNILHKTNNIVITNEYNQLDSELTDWKNLAHVRLHHKQSHLVSHSRSDFTYWTLQHKRNTLQILQLAHRNYKQYLDLGLRQQQHTNSHNKIFYISFSWIVIL